MGSSRAQHDVALDACVTEIADVVRHCLDVARNTVRPVIKEFYERVEAAVKAMPTQGSYNPEIVKLCLPEPMGNGAFSALIDEFRGAPAFEVELTVGLPPVDEAQLMALLSLHNTTLDNDIQAWVARLQPSFFQDVYRQVFGLAATGQSLSSAMSPVSGGVDAACAAFIIAKNLLDNPPQGLTIPLSEYRGRLDAVIKSAAIKLQRSYEIFKAWEDTQTILVSSTDACVRVVGTVYDEWLAAGGNPAALLGAALSDRSMHTVSEIGTDSEKYLAVWTQHNRNLTTTLNARRYVDTLALLKFKTEQLLGDRCKNCFSELVGDDAEINFAAPCVQEAKKRCEALIDSFRLEDLSSLWNVCVQIVACGIFHYTDAYKLLTGIDQAMADDPRLTVDEAALQSAAEYIVDYVCDQMEVFSLSNQ
jgi:hypothetical protein